jgi:hypothetical protein
MPLLAVSAASVDATARKWSEELKARAPAKR